MAAGFTQKEWKDRITEFPTRRQLAIVSESDSGMTVDVSRAEGLVSQEGDAYSAANMNGLEQRIKASFDNVDSDVNGVKSLVNAAGNNISGLTTRMGTAENNISGLTGRMRTAESNITKINGDLSAGLNGCKVSYEGGNFYAAYGSVKKKLGSPVPSLIVNKVGSGVTSNSKSYTATGEGYIIVSAASWSNSAVSFSVTKNGSPVSPSSSDGVSDRNKYLYCWSIPVKKGDVVLATASCAAAADLYLNMYAVTI